MRIFTLGLRAIVVVGFLLLATGLRAQSWQWAAAADAPSTGTSLIQRTVADAAGRVYAVGHFSGRLTLGSTTLVSAGGDDGFLARLSAAGTWERVWQVGGTGDEELGTVALDAAGNPVVGGSFKSPTLVVGGTALAATNGDGDVFVARLDAAGNWTQVTMATATGIDDLEVTSTGEVVVCGDFSQPTARFGTHTLPNAGFIDGFVARLSAAGTWTQAVGLGSTGMDLAFNLSLDGNDVVVIGDLRSPSVTFGPFTLTNTATGVLTPVGTTASIGFLARLSAAGTWTQALPLGSTTGWTGVNDVAALPTGETVIMGYFTGPGLTLGSQVLTAPSAAVASNTLFVARLSPAGTWTQAVTAGGPGGIGSYRMAMDAAGDVVLSGYFWGNTCTFGSFVLTNTTLGGDPDESDIYVARLSPGGTWTQALSAGGPGRDAAVDLALDAAGNVLVNGWLAGPSTHFGALTVPSVTQAGFVAKVGAGFLGSRPGQALTSLALLPNPAQGRVRVLGLPGAGSAGAVVQVLDALGRPVRQQALPAHTTEASLDLTGLTPGLYLLRCGAATGRLVVE